MSDSADPHPVDIYLAGLSAGSQRTITHALKIVAGLLSHGRCDAHTLDWGQVRLQHTQNVHAVLVEKYAAGTVNKSMSLDLGPETDFKDEEVMATIIRLSNGNFRLLQRLFSQIARVLEINELRVVTTEVVMTARESMLIGTV